MARTDDQALRAAAFRWLDEQVARDGDVLDDDLLRSGFEFEGQRVAISVQQGIRLVRGLDYPLSIKTSMRGPYDDAFEGEDTLRYHWQGSDAKLPANRALRRAMERSIPLIYLHQVLRSPSRYAVVYPVFVVSEDPAGQAFKVRTDPEWLHDLAQGGWKYGDPQDVSEVREPLRRYGTRLVKTRLHQRAFREQVLDAYRRQCAMCRLKHVDLLDAAHIDPDAGEEGAPLVSNGLSLCKIHHAAFDRALIGIEPERLVIRVQPRLLEETDGPMLRYGLQALEGEKIQAPRSKVARPDTERLRRSFERFQSAG